MLSTNGWGAKYQHEPSTGMNESESTVFRDLIDDRPQPLGSVRPYFGSTYTKIRIVAIPMREAQQSVQMLWVCHKLHGLF
jgi:hypothetical protein